MGADIIDKNGQEMPQLEMENCGQDSDTLCGMGPFKPRWLQRWATPRTFLVFYSILGTLSGGYFTYRVGVISTLEKRFAFKSKTSGLIMTIDEVSIITFGIPVGHFAAKAHRPRMLGFGMLLISLGCFLSAFPYFIYGPETHLKISKLDNATEIELCDAGGRKENCESDDRPPTMAAVFFLILAGVMNGFGNMVFHTIGLAYMDDNAKKKNTPLYLAVLFSLRMLGPLLGYVVSSVSLKYYENPFDDPGYDAKDPRWIGAWWIGFLIQGAFLFIFSVIIMLFPRRLPGHKKEEVNKKKGAKFKLDISGLLSALKRLATNPIYVALVAQGFFLSNGTLGYYMMLPKYMENQFRLSASDANMYSGPPGVIALILSLLTGGYLMWKFKPSPRALAIGFVVLHAVACFGYLLLMIPTCESVKISNYGIQDNNLELNGACNANCNCSRSDFTPVCGSDGKTVFFSPCYAGCSNSYNKTFSNCSCAKDLEFGEDLEPLTEGFCRNEACWRQTMAYTIMLPTLQYFIHLLGVADTIVLLRTVSPNDKSIATGVMEVILSIGLVPFMMVFTHFVDSLCLVWEESCGETGNCWFYDVQRFNYLLHGNAAIGSALAAVSMLVIYIYSGRLLYFYEEDEANGIETPEGRAVTKF